MFTNKSIFITGGTGSWGHELVRQLMQQQPKEIVIFSRNETSQVAMRREFEDPRLRFVIGDIRDREAIIAASAGADYLYHLAALKHVPVCEEQPYEAIKTNVIGTQNVIEAAIENKVKKVVYISTDKASNPSNLYGMTKAIGEKLIIQANLLRSGTRFACVRGGNVLGTNGSVIHLFIRQIQSENRVGITDRRMTRFFLTLEEAISLLFRATEDSLGGEIFVLKMPTCRIVDLAEVLMEALGKPDLPIEETGIRPGEKIHEILYSEFESRTTVVYDSQYLVVLPSLEIPGITEHYSGCPKVTNEVYSSQHLLMSKDEIRKMLIKGRFLP
jgi:UDP-N-acetylglucosamine 4,6-dehydratase